MVVLPSDSPPSKLPLEARLFVALLTTILIITLSLYSIVIVQARDYAEAQLRQTLSQRLGSVGRHPTTLPQRLGSAAEDAGGWGVLVRPGAQLWFTDGLDHPAPPAEALQRARRGLPAEYRTDTSLIQLRATSGGVIGLSGDLQSISAFIARLCRTNLMIAGVLVLVASGVGVLLLRLGLRPLREMAGQAHRLSASSLHERLPVLNTHDDVQALSESLNGMLERLDGSFHALRAEEARTRAFAADASHELRTPLTALTGYLEVLARAPADDVARLDLLVSARREAERAGRLVEDLLTLTRLDSGEALRPEALEVRGWSRTICRAAAPDPAGAHPAHQHQRPDGGVGAGRSPAAGAGVMEPAAQRGAARSTGQCHPAPG